MTDAHFHRPGMTCMHAGGREFRFAGVHPWDAEREDVADAVERLRRELAGDRSVGVGEIGLDRLRTRAVTPAQREMFAGQLKVAAEMGRPVVLHGAKCWGEVVRAAAPFAGAIPVFLFHGFSRSGGLLPEIAGMNGFVGVGRPILNDHAVNYRELVRTIPPGRILVETDDTSGNDADREAALGAIVAKVVEIASVPESQLESNAAAFASFFPPLTAEA